MVSRRSLKAVVAPALPFALGAGLSATIGGGGVRRVACAEDLVQFPTAAPKDGKPAEGREHAVSLPESDLVVVLRPIARKEPRSPLVRRAVQPCRP